MERANIRLPIYTNSIYVILQWKTFSGYIKFSCYTYLLLSLAENYWNFQ